jgi:hypothetical protein
VRLTVWLDSLLPRAAALALTSADRASKVAAAEFLHAATLLMVGTNARRPQSKGGDFARDPTPFHLVYRRLFPVIIDLAVDPEPVTRQLFSSLAYQLVRWFTQNQAREAVETMALLDAITEGLAGASTDASAAGAGGGSGRRGAGGAGAGAAAQRRDLCAALAAECLQWSVRGGGGSTGSGVAVNVKSILRRLFAFQTHPEPSKRLGASVALQRCLTQLHLYPLVMEFHALEILEVTLRSLRMAEGDPPRAGAEEAGALLARAAVSACAQQAWLLSEQPAASDNSSRPSRGGTFGTLPPLVAWIFTEGTARVETRARLESQLAFVALVKRLRGYTSASAWLRDARKRHQRGSEAGAGAGALWPFKMSVDLPPPETLLHVPAVTGGSGSKYRGSGESGGIGGGVAGTTAWLRSLVAVLHWARWGLEQNIVKLGDIVPGTNDSATTHPLLAAAYFLTHGVPPLPVGAGPGGAPGVAAVADDDDGGDDDDDRQVVSARVVRDWRRARVKLAVQILVLAQHAVSTEGQIKDDAGGGGLDAFLRILGEGGSSASSSEGGGGGDGGLSRLVCLAVLAPEALGADTTGGRLDDVNQLAGAAARVLAPAYLDLCRPSRNVLLLPAVVELRRVAQDSLWSLLATQSGRFDLGSVDLDTAKGLIAARRLSAGYKAGLEFGVHALGFRA